MKQSETVRDKITDIETYTNLVRQILTIDHFSLGSSQDDYLISYEGILKQDSEQAYEYISNSLEQYQLTPLFREADHKHKIILRKGLFKPTTQKFAIHIVLFLITFISIIFAGLLTTPGLETRSLTGLISHIQIYFGQALGFAISLFSILIAHEFGHYFTARYHNTRVTLPYFIPFPLSPFGTMGAFIRFLEPPKNKKVLLDIGLAGPLAGLIVAIPVLIYGLSLSTVDILPSQLPAGFTFEGNSILYLVLKYLVHGSWLPEPSSFNGVDPLVYWIQYFFTGNPLPAGGMDVMIHPIAWAGWAGLLVTSLNLLPAGQLDGGHLVYSLYGDKLVWFRPAILLILVLLGFMWSGWWLWAFMILFLGNIRAAPLDEITDLDPGRKTLARIGLVISFLIFMPVPLTLV